MFNYQIGITIFAMVAHVGTAQASEAKKQNFAGTMQTAFAKEYGQTLPPIGHVNFCAKYAGECNKAPVSKRVIKLTAEKWTKLLQVNSYVNDAIAPVSDEDLYGKAEEWEYPASAGDCEDYVLLKKRYLEKSGIPAETLLITVVLDENNSGHAVLTVRTDAGEFVLDNRRNQVMRWSDTGYHFIKRQSQKDPRAWVALTTKTNSDARRVSSGK